VDQLWEAVFSTLFVSIATSYNNRKLFGEVFSVEFVQNQYMISCHYNSHPTRVEAGSNTSTVTLRVVGGDEKGSLKSETVKYGHESQMTRTREKLGWRGPAAYAKDRIALSSERAPQKNKTVTVKKSNKYLVMSPRWGSTPRLTD
jgi:hypothetical protein